ncbi:MAG: hypothetical protein IJ323_05345 [Clostridia bacterium]|nr:hypothetical protein [Clostridia bacterium]MBQ7897833.1 hypothetical protein [Clostridia bacterium]
MKIKYILSSLLIIAVMLTLSVLAWMKAPGATSESERRPLAQFPEISVDTVLSGKFTKEFESYATDQFPFRDSFRTLKAISKFYIFRQNDNNDIYIHDGYAAKLESTISDASITNAVNKLNYLYKTYIEGKTSNVYLSIIPDKNTTLAGAGNYPSLDYNKLTESVVSGVPFAKYIDVFPLLHYTDYYKTDTHWSQEKIVDVAHAILDAMGAEKTSDYKEVTLDTDFYGVYYGQSSLPLPPDKITYLTNETIENCKVYNYEGTDGVLENIKPSKVYNMDKLNSKDPYEMFLSGAVNLMRIVNEKNTSGKKLIIFRDSYTSSLAPLMTEGYSEIILIDIRYLASHFIGAFVSPEEFENADVLFLYSALILNQSMSFK